MNQLGAMIETVNRVKQHRDAHLMPGLGPCSFAHMDDMIDRASRGKYSEAKLGRRLGYIQGVMVAMDMMTLDEVKELNKSFKTEWRPGSWR